MPDASIREGTKARPGTPCNKTAIASAQARCLQLDISVSWSRVKNPESIEDKGNRGVFEISALVSRPGATAQSMPHGPFVRMAGLASTTLRREDLRS